MFKDGIIPVFRAPYKCERKRSSTIPIMGMIAVGLVLVSALLHATWNLLAKRSADPLAFIFAFNLVSLAMFALPAGIVAVQDGIPASGVPFLLATGAIHVVYVMSLAAAYANGALSLAYPVSRGTGVLLVPLLAMPLLDERPTLAAALGIAAVLVGIVAVSVVGGDRLVTSALDRGRKGLLYALLTGLMITAYSLVDKAGVSRIHPLIYVYGIFLLMTLGMAPYVLLRRRAAVLYEWRTNRRAVLVGGALPISTYLIVLAAMRLSNVSYIVPLRETSIVFATLLSVIVLDERIGRARLVGSGLIAIGVVAIAVGG